MNVPNNGIIFLLFCLIGSNVVHLLDRDESHQYWLPSSEVFVQSVEGFEQEDRRYYQRYVVHIPKNSDKRYIVRASSRVLRNESNKVAIRNTWLSLIAVIWLLFTGIVERVKRTGSAPNGA